jgi:DNA repair exonuclease SbcCD ATPase subunit
MKNFSSNMEQSIRSAWVKDVPESDYPGRPFTKSMSSQVANDLDQMTALMNHIISLSNQIGGFNDGPHLREEIQSDVKAILSKSKDVKESLTQLKSRNASGADEYQARFDALRERMQGQLPGVINKLKENTDMASGPSGQQSSSGGAILSQALLDQDTELIDALEQQVNEILRRMRELNEIFGTTLAEIQKQRHFIAQIEGDTAEAAVSMEKGNEQLEEAAQHQKASTKCICAIAFILVVVAIGVALFITYEVHWKKSSSGGGPGPLPSPSGSVPE